MSPVLVRTAAPMLFARIVVGAAVYMIGETALADDASWYDGFKPARLVSVSKIRRELSSDSLRTSTWTITIADIDRQWRQRSTEATIEGAYIELYVVDDAVRISGGAPFRYAAGYVSEHRALGGFLYQLTAEDALGRRFAEVFQQPRIPPKRLTVAEFPGMDPEQDGKVAQLIGGEVSDENVAVPQGSVRAIFMGFFNLQTIGGIDKEVDAYLLCQGACEDVLNVYYNDPGTPDLRSVVPAIAYGDALVVPHKLNWSTWTGLATQYVDYNGVRYTPIFVDRGHPLAEAAREGRVLITANLKGLETNADATGTLIETPEELIQHFLPNFVEGEWLSGSWLSMPTIGDSGLPLLDPDSVTQAKAVGIARGGIDAAFVAGADGQPESFFTLLSDLLMGGDLEIGPNRFGQIMLFREDETATPVVIFDTRDIKVNAFDMDIDRDLRVNRLEYLYAYRYVAPRAPLATSTTGEPAPEEPIQPYADWGSGLQIHESTAAQTAVGRVHRRTLELKTVRDQGSAQVVAGYVLGRGVGPTAAKDGPRTARLITGWQGLGDMGQAWPFSPTGVVVELGTVIGITHDEGRSSDGWTEYPIRVTAIEIDSQIGEVTLEGRELYAPIEVETPVPPPPPPPEEDGVGTTQVFTGWYAAGTSETSYASPHPFGGPVSWSTIEVHQLCLAVGSYHNWKWRLPSGGPGAGKSITFTLLKNGVATALSVTISGTDTEGRDDTNIVMASPGDTFSVRRTTSGLPTMTAAQASIEFAGEDEGISWYANSTGPALSQSATFRIPLFSPDDWTSLTGTDRYSLVAAPGVLQGYGIRLSAAPGSGKSHAFAVYKNEVKQDGTGGTVDTRLTLADASTFGTKAFTLTLVAGDRIYLEVTPSGTPAAAGASVCAVFQADVDGESQLCASCGGGMNTFSDDSTRYKFPTSDDSGWSTHTVEADAEALSGITSFELRDMRVRMNAAPTGSLNLVARQNAANPGGGPSLTLDTTTEESDPTGTVMIVDGDRWALGAVLTGAIGLNRVCNWAWVQYIVPSGT